MLSDNFFSESEFNSIAYYQVIREARNAYFHSNNNSTPSSVLLSEKRLVQVSSKRLTLLLYSSFVTEENFLEISTAISGKAFHRYDLPGFGNNCSLAGIYGQEVEREEVVEQLLAVSDNLRVRQLMARDILALVVGRQALPQALEEQWGGFFWFIADGYENNWALNLQYFPEALDIRWEPFFRSVVATYGDTASEVSFKDFARRVFQQKEVFQDYVRYFIGGHIEDNPVNPYTLLTYNREGNDGALAAIAAANDVSLEIYQEFEQVDSSRLLVPVFSYQGEPQAPVISLVHFGERPDSLTHQRNHFQLLIPLQRLSQQEVQHYAQIPFSTLENAMLP